MIDHFGKDLDKSILLSQLKMVSFIKEDIGLPSDDDLPVLQILEIIGSTSLKMIPQVCRLGGYMRKVFFSLTPSEVLPANGYGAKATEPFMYSECV